MGTPEYFGQFKHWHKDNVWRSWHVYADVDENQNVDRIYLQYGQGPVLGNGLETSECKKPNEQVALQCVRERIEEDFWNNPALVEDVNANDG
tara:strand:+ start:607 stop:882 length:276 start_codon:yes stop_codon:yes gene_type:complete